MARHRTHPVAVKRQIAQEFLSGEVSLRGLAQRNNICRNDRTSSGANLTLGALV